MKASTSSLVTRVMDAIEYEHELCPHHRYEARAAIRAVAAWFEEQGFEAIPLLLNKEADQGLGL